MVKGLLSKQISAALAKMTKVNQNGKGFLSKQILAALAKKTKVNQNGKGFYQSRSEQPWPKGQSLTRMVLFFIKADHSSLGKKDKG